MATTWFGGNSAAAGVTSFGGNYIVGQSFAAPVSGNITQARGRLGNNGGTSTNAMVLIYDVSAGSPNTLLGQSNSLAIAGSAAVSMLSFTFATPPAVVSGTSYFIMLHEGTGSGVKWEHQIVGTLKYLSRNYALGPPNPFGVAGNSTERPYLEAGIDPAAAPVADFTGTPLVGTAPLTVAFTNLSTG